MSRNSSKMTGIENKYTDLVKILSIIKIPEKKYFFLTRTKSEIRKKTNPGNSPKLWEEKK